MTWMNVGSRWPTVGAVMALKTRGWLFDGPAPSKMRGGMSIVGRCWW